MTTKHDLNHLNSNGFLRLRDVLRLYPVSKSTWWFGVQKGRFPKPVKLSPRIAAWRVQDIHALIDDVARQNALAAKDSEVISSTSDCLSNKNNN